MKRVESELELPRLSETNDPLAGAISSLKQHRPDASELASLASQLAVRGIPLAVMDSAPRGSSLAWKKWALLGGGAVSGVGLWLSLRAPSAASGPIPTPPAPGLVAPSPSALGAHAPPPRRLAPPSPPRAPAAAVAPLDGGEAQLAPPLPIATTSSPSPSPTSSPSSRAPAVVAGRQEITEVPSRPIAPSSRAAPPGTVTRPSSTPDLPSATSGPSEIELLRDARLALRESPARALALVESHARAFPQGKLTQERELIAISALAALGRRTAALSRASRFEQSFPQSPYRKQIADLLR